MPLETCHSKIPSICSCSCMFFKESHYLRVYLYLTKNCATFKRSPLTRLHIATKSSLSNAFGEFDLPSQGISVSDVVAATDVVAVVGW